MASRVCPRCRGVNPKKQRCGYCGNDRVRRLSCGECKGSGTMICPTCSGSGTVYVGSRL